jgi:acetyl esterase/lipase
VPSSSDGHAGTSAGEAGSSGQTSTGGAGAGGSGAGAAGASNVGGAGAGAGAVAGSAMGGAGTGGSAGQAAQCPFATGEYFLWSGTAPGSEGATLTEVFEERSKDPSVKDRSVSGVSKPSVFAYLADKPNAAVAVIAPGGGYAHLAWDKEGIDIAQWLNSIGVSAFVLKYRLPAEFPGKGYVALADAQRALRTLRSASAACGWNSTRIGVVGFSAGGHLASQLETRPQAQTTPHSDDIDALDATPNFGVLMYPVISMDPAIAHVGSKTALLGANPTAMEVMLASSELQVTAATPPTFVGAPKGDTTVNPENSSRFATALQNAGVAHELHLYDDGNHGVGIRNATGDIAMWPAQAAAFLKSVGLLP